MAEPARKLPEAPSFQNEIDDDFQRLIDDFDSYPNWFWVRKVIEEIGSNGCKKVAAYIYVEGRRVGK